MCQSIMIPPLFVKHGHIRCHISLMFYIKIPHLAFIICEYSIVSESAHLNAAKFFVVSKAKGRCTTAVPSEPVVWRPFLAHYDFSPFTLIPWLRLKYNDHPTCNFTDNYWYLSSNFEWMSNLINHIFDYKKWKLLNSILF